MNVKRFKDPVYGYSAVPEHLCSDFIDTPGFQRLRRISQAGYAPLYPSALHNRFVHSLGVCHLASLAVDSLNASAQLLLGDQESLSRWNGLLETFKLAGLLHDFGHAPFSHAGEGFYLQINENLEGELVEAVADDAFRTDVLERPKSDHLPY